MNRQIILDVKALVSPFDMDGLALFMLAKDFEDFTKEETIKILFLENPSTIVNGKMLTTRL